MVLIATKQNTNVNTLLIQRDLSVKQNGVSAAKIWHWSIHHLLTRLDALNLKKGLTHICTVVVCVSVLSVGCANEPPKEEKPVFQHSDKKVETVLLRAFEQAGGLDNYRKIRSIRYDKRSVLYNSDGSVESEVSQTHVYGLKPQLTGRIQWNDGEESHEIRFMDNVGKKYVNDTLVDDAGAATRAFLSAYYVLFMPYKLADEGTDLFYDAQVQLETGLADVIRAEYAPDDHENHSTQDTWWYYFDVNSGEYVASVVYHEPTYALIENTETTTVEGFTFNTYRKSYRVNSIYDKEYLRGEFWYSNYQVELD